MINYSLATNWDNELVQKVSELSNGYDDAAIVEFYGSHQYSVVGTGRPSHRLQAVDDKQVKSHIELIHKNGFLFNYTLNGIINDFDGYLKKHEERLTKLLDQLTDLKVDKLTITSEDLIRFVRSNYSHFKIVVSLIAGIDTEKDARRLERYGVETITLNPHTINKDFERLKAIQEAVDCNLQLYANIPCVKTCPFSHEHYLFFTEQSRELSINGHKQDKYLQWCSFEYLKNPENFLTSPFIRPEDVDYYNEQTGINWFKLSDRSESSSFLLQTAEDYLKKSTNDLLRLVFRNGRKIKYSLKNSQYEHLQECPVPISIEVPFDNRKGIDGENTFAALTNEHSEYCVKVTDSEAYNDLLTAFKNLNEE
jgi:collagenase-like PrtC family protease